MKPPDQDDLLKEILAEDSLAALREQSLNQGLSALRGRNRRRRMMRMCAMVAAPALAIAAIWMINRAPDGSKVAGGNSVASNITRITPPIAAPATPPSPGLVVTPDNASENAGTVASTNDATPSQAKEISDEELLALFPDRAVGLIGPPGQQQLVFFDQGGAGGKF